MTTLDALVVNVDALRRDVSLLHSHYWFEVQRLRRGVAKLKRKRDYWKQRCLQAEAELTGAGKSLARAGRDLDRFASPYVIQVSPEQFKRLEES